MNFRNPKNLSAKKIVKFLKSYGFEQVRVKGDHAVFKNKKTKRATIICLSRKSFSASEVLTIAKQTQISRNLWKKI